MFLQFDKDKPGMVMLSPALEDRVCKGLCPEIKSGFKVTQSSDYNYSAGHSQEGFWLQHESASNQVKLYYPFKAPATYKLPNAWKGKPLMLFVACWNQSSVLFEQVCDRFNLFTDKIRHEDRELNIADYNTYKAHRLSPQPVEDESQILLPNLSARHARVNSEVKKYFNIDDHSDVISEMPE